MNKEEFQGFDDPVDRTGTNSVKWDHANQVFGRDVLPMWVADSDWQTCPAVIKAIIQRARHGVFGYTKADEKTDELVVDWFDRRYDWSIDSDWIVYGNGVIPSLRVCIETFTRPGDGVILQPPVYYPFLSAVRLGGSQLVFNRLDFNRGDYKMNFPNLEALCSPDDKLTKPPNPEPSMLVLCNPHNPVGRVWEKGELDKLGKICLERDLLLVSDEIHADFVYGDNRFYPVASTSSEIQNNTITLTSPSKTFNTPGLPASVAIIPNERIRRRFEKASRKLLKRPSIFGLEALEAAYRDGHNWLDNQISYLQQNLDYALQFLTSEVLQVQPVCPEGTMLLWIDLRNLGLQTKDLEDLVINQAGLGLDFGHWFGPGGQGFVRLNFACPREILREGLSRLARAVNSL